MCDVLLNSHEAVTLIPSHVLCSDILGSMWELQLLNIVSTEIFVDWPPTYKSGGVESVAKTLVVSEGRGSHHIYQSRIIKCALPITAWHTAAQIHIYDRWECVCVQAMLPSITNSWFPCHDGENKKGHKHEYPKEQELSRTADCSRPELSFAL